MDDQDIANQIAAVAANATIWAAAFTALSAVVVAIQSIYTRRSVKITREALELARSEAVQTSRVIADNRKASIDAEMPMLSVTVSRQTRQVWSADRQDELGGPEEFEPGETIFTLPRDGGQVLMVSIAVKVINDGPRSAWVFLGFPNRPDTSENPRQMWTLLPVGGEQTFYSQRHHSVAEWVDWAKIHFGDGREAQLSEREIFSLTYEFPGDTGATEWHHVIQGGSILERVIGDDAGWTVAPFTAGRPGLINASVAPFRREYWASRIDNRKL
jgi:hypothetical protein